MRRARSHRRLFVLPLATLAALTFGATACSSCVKKVWPGPEAKNEDSASSVKPIPSDAPRGKLEPTLPPAPSPHPRMLLTPERLAAIGRQKAAASSSWQRLSDECEHDIGETIESGYEAWDWANGALALAICQRVTGKKAYGDAAVKYFTALLDDLYKVGDGKGGDRVVEHDDGYPIRVRGAMAAIALDWLDGFPKMTPELKKHAVDRFVVWSKWFEKKGFSHDEPISNYYVGWWSTLAFGAIAAAGDDPPAADLRAQSAKMWNESIVPAYSSKLAGGDFPEGWQYGDNVLAFLALFCLADADANKSNITSQLPWLRETVAYHRHAITPDGAHTYDTGDWQEHPPRAQLHGVESLALLFGPADPDGKKASALAAQAKKTMEEGDEWRWLAALAADAIKPSDDYKKEPTSYLARGTATLLARSDWSPAATWIGFSSAPSLSDHQHLDAGHFEIVRGSDWLVIDSGDYAAYSSMSHNTILVDDAREVMAYTPNQGTWSDTAKIARELDDGPVVYAMADYASAYNGINTARNGKRPVTRAEREFVYLRGDNETASVVVYDRMTLTKPTYGTTFLLHGGAAPQIAGARTTFKVGKSAAYVTTLLPAGATPKLVREPTPPAKDRPFFNNEPPEGVKATRIEVASPKGSTERRYLNAIRVGAASDAPPAPADPIKGEGVDGALLGDDAFVFVADAPQTAPAALSFDPGATKRAIVVGLAPSQSYAITAAKNGDACSIAIKPGAGKTATAAGTLVLAIEGCAIK